MFLDHSGSVHQLPSRIRCQKQFFLHKIRSPIWINIPCSIFLFFFSYAMNILSGHRVACWIIRVTGYIVNCLLEKRIIKACNDHPGSSHPVLESRVHTNKHCTLHVLNFLAPRGQTHHTASGTAVKYYNT